MKNETKRDLVSAGFFLTSLLTGVFGYLFVKYFNQDQDGEA